MLGRGCGWRDGESAAADRRVRADTVAVGLKLRLLPGFTLRRFVFVQWFLSQR
jgi:hypothetical protein